ncbi:MAG: tRNA pseudouridine(38-40) synthase TruA [candidate division WOR-3 bacterium]|nr:tRNA pseudouridine(38-40) synthase TruA [candidate division WOR-3 bacterium]
MNIKLTIEYDGTDFFGFEIQPRKRTVRGEIESAICQITGEEVKVYCAGRTDKGVHAMAQIVNFHTDSRLSPGELKRAINANLPKDIYVKDAVRVSDDFHARYSAKRKIYLYKMLIGKSPIRRNYMWEYRFRTNIDALREILPVFCGRHNFKRFAKRDEGICDIMRFDIREIEDEIQLEIEGDRFLHKQVRMMIGTALLFTRGKIDRKTIICMLNGGEGIPALAPASGLYLKEIIY